MRITDIETIQLTRGITVHQGPVKWMWVRIHTDAGITGLGECYPQPEAEAAIVHSVLAQVLIGRDPLAIDRLWADMFQAVSYAGWAGAEIRAISALDIALWDIAGKSAGVPVYQLLGGASRDRIRIYNTCYDWIDFMTEPVRLARDLLQSGISAMKIWPFDGVAKETGGQFLTPEHMRTGMEPIRRIREELGDSIDLAIEFHGYWNLPSAIRIAKECEPYSPMWLEEMLPQDNLSAYKELADSTSIPLCLSERLMTRWGFREVLENRAARIIMPDICWCGGLSEARKIATHAETCYLPIAPHNCGGPVLHAASAHLAANVTNLCILETVRRHYLSEYQGLIAGYPLPESGWLKLPAGPGLGVELDESVFMGSNAIVRRYLKS